MTGPDPLEAPLSSLPGIGASRARTFTRLGISTVYDLLHYFPRVYRDLTRITPIRNLLAGTDATVRARAQKVWMRRGRNWRQVIVEARVTDGAGVLSCVWFGQSYLKKTLEAGGEFYFTGRVHHAKGLRMLSPMWEQVDEESPALHAARIVPIYPGTQGLSQKLLRRTAWECLKAHGDRLRDWLPPELAAKHRFPALAEAVRAIHFPPAPEAIEPARTRLAYGELFLLQLALASARRLRKLRPGIPLPCDAVIDAHIRRLFPFPFTEAQDRAIVEIAADLASGRPMHRLLQGDVGSGKTVVALYAALAAVAHKRQAAILAPTEILAGQHFRTLERLLAKSRVRRALWTGGGTPKERQSMARRLSEGEIDLVVGTHALLEKKIAFRGMGMVVIDEQHKFGVLQRKTLRDKGSLEGGAVPHVLVMTATPIPRTLSMTLFGDLDVSVLKGFPPGRQPVRTAWIREKERPGAYETIRREIRRGRQAYVVYPLVEESEKEATRHLRAATEMAEKLANDLFPEFRVGLLHGRMKPEEKDRVMGLFRKNAVQILVSTVVIEVGIDVPNATVLVVEHAERFGLPQLHQLRGRIGRGEHASVCLLFGEPSTPEGVARLGALVRTSDGFEIAEEDLKIRGPGELFGTAQSGLPAFRAADLIKDAELLQAARRDAFEWVSAGGEAPLGMQRELEKMYPQGLKLAEIG